MKDVNAELAAMRDDGNGDFLSRLMPGIGRERILGIRMPALRRYAAHLALDKASSEAFMASLPHPTVDGTTLHALLVNRCRDFGTAVAMCDRLLPHIDNWASCDALFPAVFVKEPDTVFAKCREWVVSGNDYTVRFGLNMLMRLFLDENFSMQVLDLALSSRDGGYYVMTGKAWFLCEALVKQWEATAPLFERHMLGEQVHNAAIRKAIESFRISAGRKSYLRTLRTKPKRKQQ